MYFLNSLIEVTFFDYFIQTLVFFGFAAVLFFQNNKQYQYVTEWVGFLNLFGDWFSDEMFIGSDSDFFNDNFFSTLYGFSLEEGNPTLQAKWLTNDFVSNLIETVQYYEDEVGNFLSYNEFFSTNGFEPDFDLLDFFIAVLGLVVWNYFSIQLSDEETDTILDFVQLFVSIFTLNGGDLFNLFLGFESLTVSFVLVTLLIQEQSVYNRSLILYFILSVAVSLFIFFFLFYIILFYTGTFFFSFINFQTFFLDMQFNLLLSTDNFLIDYYLIGLKIFFLSCVILFMFKFTVGPISLWTIFIYPTFPIIIIIIQMLFLKIYLFYLFFDIFDFVFLFPIDVVEFFYKIFSFGLIISMFIGCLAYKINDLKTIFIITTFSQIAYISIGFMSSSFLLLVYSLNYFFVYIYSVLALFLIIIAANIILNCQTLNDLAALKFVDYTMYLNFLGIIFSLSGLPPFLGFFLKYFLIIKLLTSPILFKFGVILLLTSFITMYIYLSIIYGLIKNKYVNFSALDFGLKPVTTSELNSKVLNLFNEFISVIINSIIVGVLIFLLSPFFVLFISETDDFLDFFYDLNYNRLIEILEYYFE
jgi:NADH:ubiquinone oxidoreductase subunit 2 (subunit N)